MKRVRKTVTLLALVVVLALLPSLAPKNISVRDFTSYWIAGHQLVAHHNPYDTAFVLQQERAMGLIGDKPLVMRNPPWSLWFVIPLALLGHSSAWMLWLIVSVILLAAASSLVWKMYGGDSTRRWIPLLISIAFAPTLACLAVGQTAPVVLIGLALLLYLHRRHEFWAGCALALTASKPQIALLFWLAVALWSLEHRRWKLIAGAVSTIAVAIAIAFYFDPHIFRDYRTMLATEPLGAQYVPTLGGWLRNSFRIGWLQFAPAIAGLVWAASYYAHNHRDWDWKERMPILLLVSIVAAPYGWFFDEVIVLPALIAAAAIALQRDRRNARLFFLAFILLNAVALLELVRGVLVVSSYYVWTPWAWLLIYIATRARKSELAEACASRTHPRQGEPAARRF